MGAAEAAERLAGFERAVASPHRHDRSPRSRDRRPHLRRRDHRRRRGRHRHRAPTGALSVAHRDARSRHRCRHRNIEGQHRHRAHRLRHAPGKPRILPGPARSRIADRLRAADRASPSRRPGPSWSPGTRIKRPGSTTWWPRHPGRTDIGTPTGSHPRSCARREPHLGTGATGAVVIPDESIICPWSTSIAYAHRRRSAPASN